MSGNVRPCTSCGAMVIELFHERTGNKAAISAEPHPAGNIRPIEYTDLYAVVRPAELAAARTAGEQLHINHYATCPSADRHRRHQPARRA